MTRRRPDGIENGVVEFRVTLGDLERRELRSLIKSDTLRKNVDAGRQIGQVIAIAGGVAGAGYLSYKLYNVLIHYLAIVYEMIPQIPPELQAAAEESGISPLNLAFPVTWQGPLTWQKRRDAWAKSFGESMGLR